MKQIMMSILILLSVIKINSCNLCWDYTPDRLLRQKPMQQSACTCECWKYANTKSSLTCIACGHRLAPEQIPTNADDKKYPSYRPKRWEEKYPSTQVSNQN